MATYIAYQSLSWYFMSPAELVSFSSLEAIKRHSGILAKWEKRKNAE